MRRTFAVCFALSAIFFFPTESIAQVDQAHARAWDRVGPSTQTSKQRTVRRPVRRSIPARYSPRIARTVIAAVSNAASQILPHPAGCPRRLFCGCGAAQEVGLSHRRDLWLAANWLRFPAAQPGAGMVAANRRHVMVIRQYLGNNQALVYNANGGGGRTYLHVRSLAGYKIVNPRA